METQDYMQVVVGAIVRDGHVLVGKKVPKPGHEFDNLWHIPGGKLEAKEEMQGAVAREMKEETGLDVEVIRLLAEVVRPLAKVIVTWYLCSSSEGEPCAGDDLCEVKFVPKIHAFDVCSPIAQESWPEEFVQLLRG